MMSSSLAQEVPHKVMDLNCLECHSTISWNEVKFNHKSTGFSLDGRHATIRCASCHSLKDFRDVSASCYTCHTDVHQGKLAKDCERCHTPQSWIMINTEYAHAGTTFPLIGRHATLDCHACHISEIEGEFSLIRSECISCHEADFNSALDPPHTTLGFGTRCDDCHMMLAWRPADFAKHNSFFPIYGGTHAGAWSTCYDCHIVAGDYEVFSCINCHKHNQADTDAHHREVSDYTYDSDACYRCHPSGSSGD